MILETAEKFQQNVFQNKTAVLKHFIEHRRTLETRETKNGKEKIIIFTIEKKNEKYIFKVKVINYQYEKNEKSVNEKSVDENEWKAMVGNVEPYRYPNIKIAKAIIIII